MSRAVVAVAVVAVLALVPGALLAQSDAARAREAELRRALEGRTVVVKLDMPATERGVDLHPAADVPLDYPEYAKRLKQYGTALHAGDRVTVTKLKLKGKLIEFQLGGGGFGTAGDPSANVAAPTSPKSKREQELERRVKNESDRVTKRQLQQELDDLRHAREREDARLAAATAEARERRQESIRQQALEAGSRFNLRYDGGVPLEALTVEALTGALAKYVDFGADAGAPAAEPSAPTGIAALRKGLLEDEVRLALGTPVSGRERSEGKLRVMTRTYETGASRVEAEFVEGVLIRYTISSR